MITGIYEQAAISSHEEHSEQISDRRLWTAVLLQALEDWGSSNTRLRAEADRFSSKAEAISPRFVGLPDWNREASSRGCRQ